MKVVFETATIADSVAKAARVAPTKGEAFDKASGLLMELNAEDSTAILRTTNLDIFYLEVVDAVEVEKDALWRFNAQILTQVLSKLPIGSGKMVTFTQDKGEVLMKSGRTTARFRIMDATYYPKWEPFDPEKLEMVPDLGARIKQVDWASLDGNDAVFGGIHLNGTHIIATDRIRLAMVECEAEPIYKPITIPSGMLKPILSNLRDVAIGIDEGMFLMMPDETTQIHTRIYDKEYPKVETAFNREWPDSIKFKKSSMIEMIERASIFAQNNRSPKLTFIVGKGEAAVMCSDSDIGLLGDVMDLDGQADHDRVKIQFTPRNLTDALNAAPSEEIVFHYNSAKAEFPVKIDGGSGYQALVMPRREVEDHA